MSDDIEKTFIDASAVRWMRVLNGIEDFVTSTEDRRAHSFRETLLNPTWSLITDGASVPEQGGRRSANAWKQYVMLANVLFELSVWDAVEMLTVTGSKSFEGERLKARRIKHRELTNGELPAWFKLAPTSSIWSKLVEHRMVNLKAIANVGTLITPQSEHPTITLCKNWNKQIVTDHGGGHIGARALNAPKDKTVLAKPLAPLKVSKVVEGSRGGCTAKEETIKLDYINHPEELAEITEKMAPWLERLQAVNRALDAMDWVFSTIDPTAVEIRWHRLEPLYCSTPARTVEAMRKHRIYHSMSNLKKDTRKQSLWGVRQNADGKTFEVILHQVWKGVDLKSAHMAILQKIVEGVEYDGTRDWYIEPLEALGWDTSADKANTDRLILKLLVNMLLNTKTKGGAGQALDGMLQKQVVKAAFKGYSLDDKQTPPDGCDIYAIELKSDSLYMKWSSKLGRKFDCNHVEWNHEQGYWMWPKVIESDKGSRTRIVETVKDAYSENIREFFGADSGAYLQAIEAEITMRVFEWAVIEQGWIAYPNHDELIVEGENAEAVRQKYIECFKLVCDKWTHDKLKVAMTL